MKILIAGDYCPSYRVNQAIANRGGYYVLADVATEIKTADYAIANLECPVLADSRAGGFTPIEKIGPNLSCGPEGLKLLQEAGFKCVTLANNHIFDYGQAGMESTIDALSKSNLDSVGAGSTLSDAQQTLYLDICGKRLAIISACENEFSIATAEHGGANELDPISLSYQIKEAKVQADCVIVILHGGKEHYQLPLPGMKRTYRFLADCGADVIVNHHQHCFSGYEVYHGVPIFYGIGNFCFDSPDKEAPTWNYGYMVELDIADGSDIKFRLLPYEQCKAEPRVKLLTDTDGFFKQIDKLNAIIADDIQLNYNYQKKIHDSYTDVMLTPLRGRYWRALIYRRWIPSLVTRRFKQAIAHQIRCAAHREGLLTWIAQNSTR